jgi:hypothetical protein
MSNDTKDVHNAGCVGGIDGALVRVTAVVVDSALHPRQVKHSIDLKTGQLR